jgi:hypothetical protein
MLQTETELESLNRPGALSSLKETDGLLFKKFGSCLFPSHLKVR